MGLRLLGFSVLGLRLLGFRVWGFGLRLLGFWLLGLRLLGLRVQAALCTPLSDCFSADQTPLSSWFPGFEGKPAELNMLQYTVEA